MFSFSIARFGREEPRITRIPGSRELAVLERTIDQVTRLIELVLRKISLPIQTVFSALVVTRSAVGPALVRVAGAPRLAGATVIGGDYALPKMLVLRHIIYAFRGNARPLDRNC